MNPILLAQQLQHVLVRYLLTTFDVNRDGQEPELAAELRARLNQPGALFRGPYLELTPPYRTGQSLRALCAQGVLTPDLLRLSCFERNKPIPADAPLFVHQERAIRKLCVDGRSVVISSGTGSGKTEGFLIPILDDLLRDSTPGVRALLIYPMNALVNDQLDRLRGLLAGTEITFGRYTSELRATEKEARQVLRDPMPNEVISREEIRTGRKLPQILITNYAMLEYLLLRPQDTPLFQSGAWRFVVLDEAHTYAGAQGIEVAMLMRRLKHRLGKGPGEVRCIATSATLTDDNTEAAVTFAQNLFGEKFATDDIIFGEIDRDFVPEQPDKLEVDPTVYMDPRLVNVLDVIRSGAWERVEDVAQQLFEVGLVPEETVQQAGIYGEKLEDLQAFLYEALRSNADLIHLRHWMLQRLDEPMPVEAAAEELFGTMNAEVRQEALYRLIELGSLARPGPDMTSLLPARYHLFARSPQGVWACINPYCEGRQSSESTGWSRLFTERRECCDVCGSLVYPLYVCRQCGQVYIRTQEQNGCFVPEAKDWFGDARAHYFAWRKPEENRAMAAEDEDEDSQAPLAAFEYPQKKICVKCGKEDRHCSCECSALVTLYSIHATRTDKRGTKSEPVEKMNECPRCRSKAYKDTEISTPISVGGSTPLAIMTYELYRALPPSSKAEIRDKPGEGRKLLTFYDSRQGAARFAAFLQDVVNQQNYRHIIPKAVAELIAENGWWPSFAGVSERCTQLAWKYQIFHNDPDTDEWRQATRRMSCDQERKLIVKVQTQILAEFTTQRRDRQSLEALGLVGIAYFEKGREPDFSSLARRIGLTAEQTRTLIEYLLDDLRSAKVIVLPNGVHCDDPVFGRNQFSPRLIKGGSPGPHEIPWIGATPRQRRRQYVQLVLKVNGLPADDKVVEDTLSAIWEWLVRESDLLDGRPADGYQLHYRALFFRTDYDWYRCERCQRLHYRGDSLPCPQPNCGGVLHPIPHRDDLRDNFYFWVFDRSVVPMRVEEHTAQLDSEKGREYQDEFRDGNINVLSCSTTFEMGIDLGDLQAVVMNNVPPTVANYRQRSGRAGRRTSGTAFILTWAADRPHDQAYFRAPTEIIRGRVRVPFIALDNSIIQRRHTNAILLSLFLRYRMTAGHNDLDHVGPFFDEYPESEHSSAPHYAAMVKWIDLRHDEIYDQLAEYGRALGYTDPTVIEGWIAAFQNDMQAVYTEHYRVVAGYYYQEIKKAQEERKARREARDREERYERLWQRLRGEFLIDYLSSRGVLPSYSFPLYTVELMLPYERRTEHLRLQRDLSDAIREYAPGSEVVADKRIWRSGSVVFLKETVRDREYRICEQCGHLQISREAGIPLDDGLEQNPGMCPVCGSAPSKRRREVSRFVIPDGFRADPNKSGRPAKQYVRTEPNVMRSALIPGQEQLDEKPLLSDRVYCSYDRAGRLLYVNEGTFGRGFEISLRGGLAENEPDKTQIRRVSLGHIQETDTLHLRFASVPGLVLPSPSDISFWLSLMAALIQGASHSLQIERRDIDGVLYPRRFDGSTWGQTIVLYDNVPGGAGHVRQIRDHFEKVLQEAFRVVSCPDCGPETSCYHCLRDYSNQTYHSLLRRDLVWKFLHALLPGPYSQKIHSIRH